MLTKSLFNGMAYAGESTVIPMKMHLYIQALAFVQGMTLRAVHEDCASRFLAEKAWEKGLRWRSGPPSLPAAALQAAALQAAALQVAALPDQGWVEVNVRMPCDLADHLVEVGHRNGVGLPDVLYTMLYWYSWILYPPLHEQERRKAKLRVSQTQFRVSKAQGEK